MSENCSDSNKQVNKMIPDFVDDPNSIFIPELNFEDDGIYVNCTHCGGSGFLYGDTGRICPECDGNGIGGMR